MFDFIDAGIMEGIQHRLCHNYSLIPDFKSIAFKGRPSMRRKLPNGIKECYVRWWPENMYVVLFSL